MRAAWFSIAVIANTVALTLGLVTLRSSTALAPNELSSHPLLDRIKQVDSLDQLYQMRDRLNVELTALPKLQRPQETGALSPYVAIAQLTQRLSRRIRLEEEAEADYRRALELAEQALQTRQTGQATRQALQQEEFLWQAAIAQLNSIPADSVITEQATAKAQEYQQIVEVVADKVDQAESGFLQEIAAATDRPEAIRITLCHIDGECRDFQGDVPPASPASLIKLPIAVALMQKVTQENIDLDSKIYIDPGNFTENANGAKIFVDREYPLREVMARMIKESNNIATNQLIDYIGRDAINQTFRDRGFNTLFVDYKLVGDSTYPANAGSIPNRMTANELTEMMRQIYLFQHPGDEEILDALVGQYDWEFGYAAINELNNKRVHWIGEKLGQNSKVIGTVLAFKVDDERYIMTVTIDYSANQRALRDTIKAVISHILQKGHLVPTGRQLSP
ncbi:serine hydrolase [Almyronema epifaneia]|uniref:Serine hydrolase n=1 Tax=Almyronema epifaneia S1 TaxID=2991925 RepID=A0ABW6IGW3_9CYAN